MDKQQAITKLEQMKKAVEALPDGAEILSATIDWDQRYDQILLHNSGFLPEWEKVKTKVEDSGATAKTVLICGIFVKWYPKEENE